MRYFTFDASGDITGAFIQDLAPEHAEAGNWIEVTEAQYTQRFACKVVDGQIIPITPPVLPVVPQSVTYRQGMAVLLKYGLDTEIETLLMQQIDAAEQSGNADAILHAKFALNDYLHSTAFDRDWPLIEAMRQLKGWTSEYVDQLFIEAAAL